MHSMKDQGVPGDTLSWTVGEARGEGAEDTDNHQCQNDMRKNVSCIQHGK